MTATKIELALENLASRKIKKIAEKYAGDKAEYKAKIFECLIQDCGNVWQKDDIKRVYMNKFNMFYDYETKALEAIDASAPIDFDGYENRMIKLIDSE